MRRLAHPTQAPDTATRDISIRRSAPCCAAPPTRTRLSCFTFRFVLMDIDFLHERPSMADLQAT